MANEYFLSCSCGEKHRVSARHSGESIRCSCGNTLQVPSLRDLSGLELAPALVTAPQHAWGPRQGLSFFGVLLLAGGLLTAAVSYLAVMPGPQKFETPREALEELTPSAAWHYWGVIQYGIPRQATVDVQHVLGRTQMARKLITIGLVAGGAGLLLLIAVQFLPARGPTAPLRQKIA